jgi:predicted nucleic acid-binding protein
VTPDVKVAVCRDPHDDKFLEVAVTGKADVVVSGDNDLLTMAIYAGIPIVSANQFLTMLESPDTR